MTDESVFAAALEKKTPAERSAFLDQACADNPAVRSRVEALLKSHEEAGSFLESPAVDLNGGRQLPEPATQSYGPISEGPGTRIGPYKLLQQIGEGGMGVVYMAEQEQPVRRKVALKIIKPGMDTRQVIVRFEAERQALAMMEHPNIARVLDAGATETGRPFFVMELVKGIPITKYCDQEHLTPKERLDLFIPVCQAVQHAHQKGIIHRDLKPSNVLIALYDGKPVPKVIDFGVAKATAQNLTERTMFTEVGSIVGTLEYMAPEQAELNNLDIDTRADIYSLGVLLYELLTGSPPFSRKQLQGAALDEMLRMIREVEPPKPSTRISSSNELPSIAANRHLEPTKLAKFVRGELDWIVMKCLEKDRGRRYETANALAMDVQRYLAEEPVMAGPPSAVYRLRKFVARNRAAVGVAAIFVALLISAGVVSTSLAVWAFRERDQKEIARQEAVTNAAEARNQEQEARKQEEEGHRQRQAAEEQAAIAQAVNNFLHTDLLEQANPLNQPVDLSGVAPDADIKVRTLLDRAGESIEGKFKDQPLTEAAIRLTVGNTYRLLGEFAKAQPHLERSVALRSAKLGVDHIDALGSRFFLAELYEGQGEHDQAESLHLEVLQGRTAKLPADHLDVLYSKKALAWMYMYRNRGKSDEVEPLLQEVVQGLTAKLGSDDLKTMNANGNLAVCYVTQRKYNLAEPLLKELVQARTAKLGADHPDTGWAKHYLAVIYRNQGKYDQAAVLLEQVLQTPLAKRFPDHPRALPTKAVLAAVYQDQGKYDQAERLFREVLQGSTAKLGADHPLTHGARKSLSDLLRIQGKQAEADSLLDRDK